VTPLTLLLGAVLLAAPVTTDRTQPAAPEGQAARAVKYPEMVTERLLKQIYADREREENWLRMDSQSYFAAVQRKDFGTRASLVVGSASDCDIRIEDPLVRPHHVRVTAAGDSFRVEALDDSALIRVDGTEGTQRDTTVAPASLSVSKLGGLWGRYHLRLSHQQHPAILLLDSFSPRYKEFHGRKSYTVDLAYRFSLPLIKNPAADTVLLATTRGAGRKAVRVGWFDFMIGEKRCRLTALHTVEPGIPPDAIAVFFRDATTGKETSPIGRYVEVHPAGTHNYVLDFNMAVNPACAFSDLYNCPIPPRENVLAVPILAGEKDLHYLPANAQLRPE